MEIDRFLQAKDCELMTGIAASTWRWWAYNGQGPKSFKLGGRRVWRESVVMEWIATQEATTSTGGED
ncbi:MULTISPECIES: helix-turn-helix transcriptional regulator [Nocardia]|uniref:AlpA family phage regulatory protein n=1 Tax=Nocardia nova TaxID=37330 RepID=A0A2T2ZE39_9NOCA|nr:MULTISPECIES: AlpA family phage regulatory protein [Nocardia]PSR66019.1 AlpA family phage regulatory protein [Nocardia nova]